MLSNFHISSVGPAAEASPPVTLFGYLFSFLSLVVTSNKFKTQIRQVKFGDHFDRKTREE